MTNDEMIEMLADDVIAWGGMEGRPDATADLLVSDWVEWTCNEHEREYDAVLKLEAEQLKAALVRRGFVAE